MVEIRRLDERAKQCLNEARAILELAERESRAVSSEEQARFDALHDEADRAIEQRELLKRQYKAERREVEETERAREAERRARATATANPADAEKRYAAAFRKWIRGGVSSCTLEERQALIRGQRTVDAADVQAAMEGLGGDEARILGTGVGASPYGGYLIPEEFMRRVEVAMLAWNGMFRAPCEQFTTGTGAPMPWPMVNDTSELGELVAEGSATDLDQDFVVSRVVFDAFLYSSKIIRVQRQLVQDAFFDLEGLIARVAGERLGRITGTHLTTGDGSAKPLGVVAAAADSGLTWSIAGALPKYSDIVDLVHSIDAAYRDAPGMRLMFHDTGLKYLRKLLDTTNRPIWDAGGTGIEGAPPTILGYPYVVNNYVPVHTTATNKAWLAGDFSRYKIRRVANPIMLRLEERFAEYFQIGFCLFLRLDGDLVDGAGGAIKYADMAT